MRAADPAAMTVPPASTNFLTLASAVAPVPVPLVTWQRLRRSGSVDCAPAPAAAAGSASPPPPPPPPPPPRPPPPPGRKAAPDGMTITSYFDRSAVSSKPAPQTTLKGNSKRSRRNRVQPEGIDPVVVSHNAIRRGASRVAPAGAALTASTLTPSSCAPFCTIGVELALGRDIQRARRIGLAIGGQRRGEPRNLAVGLHHAVRDGEGVVDRRRQESTRRWRSRCR